MDNDKALQKMSSIPIKRFTKVNNDYRVYDTSIESREYWKKREYTKAKDSIYGSGEDTMLFKRQKGKCAYCKNPTTQEQIQNVEIQKHHMKPRSFGGDTKPNNLRLLHKECHQTIHSLWTREQLAQFIDNGIDYLRLLKPKHQH